MKIAVISTGPTIDHCVGTGVNHSGYLLIIDPATMQYEALQNPIVNLKRSASGKLLAQLLLKKGVDSVLVKSCSTEARKVFEVVGDAGIPIFVGITGSVRKAVERFKK